MRQISESLELQLKPVYDCLQPEFTSSPKAPEDPYCALEYLNKIDVTSLESHEPAEVWNLYGYAYLLLEDFDQASIYYTQIANDPDANFPLRSRSLKTLYQLNIGLKRWADALAYYNRWMTFPEDWLGIDGEKSLSAYDRFLLAHLYYMNYENELALENILVAIDETDSSKASWNDLERTLRHVRGECPSEEFQSAQISQSIEAANSLEITNSHCVAETPPLQGVYKISEPVLNYPKEAVIWRSETVVEDFRPGYVLIEYTVGVDGKTKDFEVLESSETFYADSAIEYAKWFVYRPWIVDDEPIEFRQQDHIYFPPVEELTLRPIVQVSPYYPQEALQRGLSGYAVVGFEITGSGQVRDIELVETTDYIFVDEAMDKAKLLRYGRLPTVEGVPVSIWKLYKFSFEIE